MKRTKFSNITSKVDIAFPEETIVHAILAEQHIASAHDSLVDADYDDNENYDNFKASIWKTTNRFLISEDIVMNCFYSMDFSFLQRINETIKLDWSKLKVEQDIWSFEELSEAGKILYAIIKAVKKIYHQFAGFEEGCYSTEKVLGAFYVIVNVFHDDEGPYITMNVSLNDIYDGVSWT